MMARKTKLMEPRFTRRSNTWGLSQDASRVTFCLEDACSSRFERICADEDSTKATAEAEKAASQDSSRATTAVNPSATQPASRGHRQVADQKLVSWAVPAEDVLRQPQPVEQAGVCLGEE